MFLTYTIGSTYLPRKSDGYNGFYMILLIFFVGYMCFYDFYVMIFRCIRFYVMGFVFYDVFGGRRCNPFVFYLTIYNCGGK